MWGCWDKKPKKVMIKNRMKVIQKRKDESWPSKAEKYIEYKRRWKNKYRWT
jgi:hypothetical protein